MQSAEHEDLKATIHAVDQKVDRLAMGVVGDLKKVHETTQGGLDDFREFAEFLATRTEANLKAHVTAEVGAVRTEIGGEVKTIRGALTAIERRFDRLEERLLRKRQ